MEKWDKQNRLVTKGKRETKMQCDQRKRITIIASAILEAIGSFAMSHSMLIFPLVGISIGEHCFASSVPETVTHSEPWFPALHTL